MTFQLGDKVTWVSQANGGHTRKVGMVVGVIPPGREGADRLRHHIDALVKAGTHRSSYGGGLSRDHESYLVEVVVGTPRAKRVLYWPVTKLLAPATPADLVLS